MSALAVARAESSLPREGFAEVNGSRLQFLDWGGAGPTLILIHGLADNPRVFDDLAMDLRRDFHVVAYARRGSGNSAPLGPFDNATSTEDLFRLMGALGIARADLIALSAGGAVATEMAADHPERVHGIIYLDGAYDWSSATFKGAVAALPTGFFDPPPSALASPEAFLRYQRVNFYPRLNDMTRIEQNLLDKVDIQEGGHVTSRLSSSLVAAIYEASWHDSPPAYAKVKCPALALYAETLYDRDIQDTARRQTLDAYERTVWKPFQEASIAEVRRDLVHVRIAHVHGAHVNFFLMQRAQVLRLIRHFLRP